MQRSPVEAVGPAHRGGTADGAPNMPPMSDAELDCLDAAQRTDAPLPLRRDHPDG